MIIPIYGGRSYKSSLYRAEAFEVPDEESCECCESAVEYFCNKRPLQTYFFVLLIWTALVPSLVYLQTRHRSYSAHRAKGCPGPLDQTDDRNAEMVLNYPLGDSASYISALGLADKQDTYSTKSNHSAIVTFTSQALFPNTTSFIKHLRKEILSNFSNMKLVLFHMDLTEYHRKTIKEHCNCDVRLFPVNKFPYWVQDYTVVWQPLIIQLLLQEYSFIMWMDPIHHSKETVRKAMSIAKRTSIATSFIHSPDQPSLGHLVDPETLATLGEVQCAFKSVHKFNSSLLVIYEDGSGYTSRYIMRPWVSCALTKGCMSPDSQPGQCSNNTEQCNNSATLVLSIILHRLYYNDFRDKGKFPFEIS